MMASRWIMGALAVVVAAGVVQAATTLPNTFQSGGLLKASELMETLEFLATRIDEVEANTPTTLEPPTYDSAEHELGSKWTDGKLVYRKVVSLPPPSPSTKVDHAASIGTLIRVSGMCDFEGTFWPIPYVYAGSAAGTEIQVAITVNDAQIHLISPSDWSGAKCHVVLEYTKPS